ANEGISVVQVAGTSRANAFALSGPGYVAVGPWRYDLHAFAPGDSDAGQRQVIGSGNNFWDYRLATECIVSSGQTCTPDDGGKGRPAVVPQLPAYVAAPTAMLAFGLQITDTLHQRLGEVRNDQFSTPADSSGEVFVRVRGSGNTYHSDHAFSDFGYNFSEHSIAMQMGISKLSIDADAGSMRVGGAVTVGRTNVNPHAADGWSQIQFNNASLAGLVTWQGAKGWYADGVLSYDNYRGNISTAPHGDRVGRLIGNGWTASAETGYNMAMSGRMRLEPEAQITYQQVNIDNSTDTGGLHVQYGNIAQMVVRVGARLAWTLGDTRTAKHWTPYLKGNIYNSFGGRPRLTASSDALNVSDNFSSGSFGSIWELGAGATGTLARNMSLYGDVDYRGELGSSGMSGWTGNIGLRVEF
ncbi:MAG: autotransporter outer membrane beta-barrel domain-containing protein, partial [Rhodanobacter sp.]